MEEILIKVQSQIGSRGNDLALWERKIVCLCFNFSCFKM